MRAAVCHAFGEPLRRRGGRARRAAPGEVRVRVAACAVCHSDVAYASGAWGGALPAIYGHEAAGTSRRSATPRAGSRRATTSSSRSSAPAESATSAAAASPRSAGRASHSTSAVRCARPRAPRSSRAYAPPASRRRSLVHSSQAVRIRPEMPLDRACLLACGVVTGYGAVVNTAQLAAGDSVAVIGAGGVGVNCIQGAMLAGADPIIAIDVAPASSRRPRRSARRTSSTPARRRRARRPRTRRAGAASIALSSRPAPPPRSTRRSRSSAAAARS